MRFGIGIINGLIINFVAGYSFFAPDWQAWILLLWFIAGCEIYAEDVARQAREAVHRFESRLRMRGVIR